MRRLGFEMKFVARCLSKVAVSILTLFILFYQKAISPHFMSVCRFYPSCSTYALISIKKYGVIKGCFLVAKRLLKCHPLHKGGYDPVP